MKITDVRVVSKEFPDAAPPLVEVTTDEGITGIGATAAHTPAIAALIEGEPGSLRGLLIGEDPTGTNGLVRKMFGDWQAQRGRGGEGGIGVNAMAAIDIALWDIAGKARGLPVYKLLGGAVQDEVMVYASTSATDRRTADGPRSARRRKTAEEMAAECKEYVRDGFKAIKFGWGNNFGPEDRSSLAAIRDAVGPDIRVMLDFGCPAYLDGGWNAKDAIRVTHILEEYDIYFLEEALHPYDVLGFAELTRGSPIKIATGESLTTVRDFQHFIDARALDVVQPDAQQMGITQLLRVAQRSEEAGILCIPHCPWTALAVAAHLNALCTVTNAVMIEYPGFASFERDSRGGVRTDAMHTRVIETPLTLRDGYLQLPEGPGLGLGDFAPDLDSLLASLAG